jgi:hypothetical protein
MATKWRLDIVSSGYWQTRLGKNTTQPGVVKLTQATLEKEKTFK